MTTERETDRKTERKGDGCARRLRVLADETRLAVLRLLLEGPRHVWEMNEEIGIDQSLLSHHLRTLRDAGLVVSERDGRTVLYRLAPGVRVRSERGGIDLGCCFVSFDRS